MLPNFLCIGSQKAGTSWLYDMLKQHPDIWLPDIKEVHYFDYYFGEGTGAKQWAPKHIEKAMERIRTKKNPSSSDKAYINGLELTKPLTKEWYSALFNHTQAYERALKGEITPEYSAINEAGVKEIREELGDIKIIWLIRDPIARAISQTKMVINRSKLNPALIDEGNIDKYVRFKGRADYIKSIPLWEKYFSDILYLPYGDIKSRPDYLLDQLSAFLEVKSFGYKNASKVVHKTKPVELTASAVQVLESYSMPQYDFLEKKFGPEFMKRIK
ncbi:MULTISPECIES: sulfotransferase [unclassified Cobetia]|uniref:sulfotransferase n=1 Tax=unclassified Cobetia TaxID=2609414 RepID=UPI00178CAAB9|nr:MULTISPECIES: sulfotransferase [unclassified Cobetia]MBE2169944.1 sulfotransferase [Cobetia sp. 2AS1]MDH2446946.1 sulfotransferase [Cobetia sp. 2AS]